MSLARRFVVIVPLRLVLAPGLGCGLSEAMRLAVHGLGAASHPAPVRYLAMTFDVAADA